MPRAFWLNMLERALKTFAQTMLALLGAGAVNLIQVDWIKDLPVAGGAAFLSLLTSLAAVKVDGSNPPAAKEEETNGTTPQT
jgi:hypothetical protein